MGTRPANIIRADSNELGKSTARSKWRSRIARVIRDQSAIDDGRCSLQTWSMNGADVNSPATHGRTSRVIFAPWKCSRTAFIAGIAKTESPTQLGPRISLLSICMFYLTALVDQARKQASNPLLREGGVAAP